MHDLSHHDTYCPELGAHLLPTWEIYPDECFMHQLLLHA
jgi:hypothetical protein